ncbi:glycoside hydrolase family 32 protein [Marinomonas sp. BSi20584]|uniref:glycoside hydrolase family 32 protein n=1 Tax=Marinomonas sp. BSi20584 TaxID=1594462 RepID=UPI000C1EAA5F|nr:glycoside hydrolase family 32 protein [Marinomonas sp. BSi20584]PJE57189.1 hypothetical protein TY87_00510 [Marinomonas sp. BSi20584]
MSSKNDLYRPAIHFSPAFGWLNDPNGLVYSEGQWHMFYQYYPMDTIWGPMHWGHAVSQNLVTWQHYPIALAPDELGNMFSGSAIVDKANTSGLFEKESEANLVAYYTASLPSSDTSLADYQTQCLAYSDDQGLNWIKYEQNPILNNPKIECFRDPKVFWFEQAKHWVMVITHGQSIGIYYSQNMVDWELSSDFGAEEGHHSNGPWECPDLFPLTAQNGVTKWIMVVGIGDGCYAPGSGTQYFIGDFDGKKFTNDGPADKVLWMDYGRDYYATQSWFNAPDNKRIAISWMSNWRYARQTETKTFRGIMTLPREFSLIFNESGHYILKQSFYESVSYFLNETMSNDNVGVFRVNGKVMLEIGEEIEINLFEEDCPQFIFKRLDAKTISIINNRLYLGSDKVMEDEFSHNYTSNITNEKFENDLEIIVDKGAVELLFADGTFSMTQLYFPDKIENEIQITGSGRFSSIAEDSK